MPNSGKEFKERTISLLRTYISIVQARKDASAGTPMESYLDGYLSGLQVTLAEIEKMEA